MIHLEQNIEMRKKLEQNGATNSSPRGWKSYRYERLMYENLPTTREEAKRLGAKRYFTGKLCCRGHLSPRYTYGACVACKSETRKRPPRKLVPLEIKKAKKGKEINFGEKITRGKLDYIEKIEVKKQREISIFLL